MERASKALRRSGVRLKSLGGGHADLNIIISELKDIRQASKNFMTAQNSVAQDMVKWAQSEDNRAIQDIMTQLSELNTLWTDVQKEFVDNIRAFKYQFEMILEGEKQVDQARNHLVSCEQRECKIRKELKRASKKVSVDEINNLEIKLSQAERSKDLAQLEVVERVHENEAVKLLRLKDGLLKLSDAYLEMATKCAIIFEAQNVISHQLPDVHDCDLHEIKYTGSGTAKLAVLKTRDKVQDYKKHRYQVVPTNLSVDDPPPPYTPGYYDPVSGRPFEESDAWTQDAVSGYQLSNDTPTSNVPLIQRQRAVGHSPISPSCPPYPAAIAAPLRRDQSFIWSAPSDLPSNVRWEATPDYEEELTEAMGAAKM